MKKGINILIVDDDVDFANYVADVAAGLDLNCKTINKPEEFMKSFDSSVTLIFMDLNMPNVDGIELLRFIETKKTTADIILMSGVDKRVLESAREYAISKDLSIIGHFQKPIRLSELENILKKSIAEKSHKHGKTDVSDTTRLEVTKEGLLEAIHHDQFVVFYQPKVDIKTLKIIGVEALIRWKHSSLGLIFPDQFIALAESYGLIDAITWIVIKKSLHEMKLIQGKIGFSLKVSINLSPYSLHDLTYPDKLMAVLAETNIDPEDIILEVTETGLLKELSAALDIFTRLRLKKIQLSIDDFGTGYSMMQQLKIIPATEIKIDKSFVLSIFESVSSNVTVRKIIEMGHELGMKVVAEGVETKEQLLALHALQCDIVQGYYFSKPIPANELIEWINKAHYQLEY